MSFSISSATLSVYIKDLSHAGRHELTLTAVVNDSINSELVDNQNTLIINVGNTCAFTKIIPEELDDMTLRAGEIMPRY